MKNHLLDKVFLFIKNQQKNTLFHPLQQFLDSIQKLSFFHSFFYHK